ncbi:MAG TPA: hypothetical protein VMT59_14310 [Gaiellaceae bacterium]|nr:hypothetical protein [Gaiellaceae bacterium]
MDNPDSSQASVSSGDFFVTSAYADGGLANGGNLIQQGVTYEYKAAEGPSCNLGSSSPALYYFTEKRVNGTYSCYSNGSATFSTSHLQTVDRGSDGTWYAYRDGSPTGITTTWSACGGDACTLAAFAEEASFASGAWAAKYAGSGNTAWQWWNGAAWNTINSATTQPGTYWSAPSGPFPGGIWSFTYSH